MSAQLPATNPGPLFVLSVWRTGSSLLYALLNQHPDIALLYEGDLPRLHRYLFGRFRNGTWRERWEFWNQAPSRHGIAMDSMPANVANAWEATRIVYRDVALRKKAKIWGEKTPHWYDCPLQMAKQFPDGRFIFLWRDLNAVMGSINRAARSDRFFRKAGFANKILVGTDNLRRACDVLTLRGQTVHEVNYEDLTTDTADCMEQICRFLQIPFDSRITSLEGADTSAIGSGDHHTKVRGDRVFVEKKQTALVPPAMQAKINRYIRRWQQSHKGEWPKYPAKLPKDVKPAGPIEILQDRIVYHLVLGRDHMVALLYALVPMHLARRLRAWARRNDRVKQVVSAPLISGRVTPNEE